jgi:malonyl-CoA O-methyltransferase
MNSVARAFSQAAAGYDALAVQQAEIGMELQQMARPDWSQVLDIGCGPGRLAMQQPQAGITGMDLAFGMCQQARHQQTQTLCADALNLPFAEGVFPTVYSALAWQWVEDTAVAAAEVFRVLRDGGIFLLATYQQGTLRELKETFEAAGRQPRLLSFRSMEEDVAALENAGFMIRETQVQQLELRHDSFLEMLRYLHRIGAHHGQHKARGMTRGALRNLEAAYGDPVSFWQAGYLVAEKV